MFVYKSTDISNIDDFSRISDLCSFDNYYYFKSDIIIEEATQISNEEFNEIISRIEEYNEETTEIVLEPTNREIVEMISNVEETQLTQLMALADIYETIVAE